MKIHVVWKVALHFSTPAVSISLVGQLHGYSHKQNILSIEEKVIKKM